MAIKNKLQNNAPSAIIKKTIQSIMKHTPFYHELPPLKRCMNADETSDYIYNLLESGKPCLITRYGDYELMRIEKYLGHSDPKRNFWRYITGQIPQYWWNNDEYLHLGWPVDQDFLCQYAQRNLEDSKIVDVLGSWKPSEYWLEKYNYLPTDTFRTHLLYLEPWLSSRPWSRYLKGKRVLVIHMFKDTIEDQYYNHRTELFEDPDVLPEFASLRIIKSIMISETQGLYKDWFDILEYYKKEMDKEPYDVVLISCSTPGFCLAAHAKRTGHQAFHLGGALQLMFGIKGKRWENPRYASDLQLGYNPYLKLFNDSWVKPKDTDIAQSLRKVENGCYV